MKMIFCLCKKGYRSHCKHRSKSNKRSGGIVIVFKDNLDSFLKFPKSESEFVQWVVIDKSCFSIEENLLLGCVYVPPEIPDTLVTMSSMKLKKR